MQQENCTTEEYFDLVRIEESDRHRLIKEYSYGMKNKLQLLCCLMKNPKVILLDEPLSSFDIIVSHDIKELLLSMKHDHIILMSTHIMQLARDVSDEIVILKNGVLSKAEMAGESETEFEQKILALLESEESK
ncbi:MAG: ATP-binding cassette domain-containing protein [Lachnospiraceae bacterium]